MKAAVFYDAQIPEPFRILGRRLKPLSLGHLVLLHRIESPFVTGQKIADIGELALAVLFCSMSYEEGVEALSNPGLDRAIYKWGKKIVGRKWFWPKSRPINIAEKISLFADYIEYSSELPEYSWRKEEGSIIDAPQTQVVKVQLMTKTSLTESEILNRPWRLCLLDMLTLRAMEGQIQFHDRDMLLEAQQKANEFAERFSKKNGGQQCPD